MALLNSFLRAVFDGLLVPFRGLDPMVGVALQRYAELLRRTDRPEQAEEVDARLAAMRSG